LEIIKARFGSGEAAMSKGFQTFRNLTNTVLLGNPISAMTQIGDLAFSMHKYGYLNAAKALFGEKLVKKETLGLLNIAEDLVANPSRTARTLDRALKWSGFDRIDRLGKETYLNAALKFYKKQVLSGKPKDMEKFKKKWGGYFDEKELEDVTRQLQNLTNADVKANRIPDKVREILWHEIADVQPIAKSEMPLLFNKDPKLRVLYMLRSFTIKQLDYMRRMVTEAPNKTTAATRLAHFSMLFIAANTSIDVLKDVIRGKEFSPEDHAVDNLLSLVGGNKYMLESASKEGPARALIDYIAPPGALLDIGYRAYKKGEPEGLLDYIPSTKYAPIGGKLVKDMYKNYIED